MGLAGNVFSEHNTTQEQQSSCEQRNRLGAILPALPIMPITKVE